MKKVLLIMAIIAVMIGMYVVVDNGGYSATVYSVDDNGVKHVIEEIEYDKDHNVTEVKEYNY